MFQTLSSTINNIINEILTCVNNKILCKLQTLFIHILNKKTNDTSENYKRFLFFVLINTD